MTTDQHKNKLPDHKSHREQLLDHEYDGIREYDNPAPGWWHMIFIATCVFAVLYTAWYHFSEFSFSRAERYDRSVAAYYQQLFGELGELTPDEPTILKMMADEKWVTVGKNIFLTNCAQCHAADGAGINGANLTDDSWINVKKLTDILDVINDGVVAKGMPAWSSRLRENEIILVTAYVASIRGSSPPNGKPAQGSVISPWPPLPAPEESSAE